MESSNERPAADPQSGGPADTASPTESTIEAGNGQAAPPLTGPRPAAPRLSVAEASKQLQRPLLRFIQDWWIVELCAIVVSCVLTVVLCVLLATYNGRVVPSFGSVFNSGITLGTLVTLLVTLAVAFSLFAVQEGLGQLKWPWYLHASRPLSDLEVYDEASRGFIGSLQLLWAMKASAPIASLGALLVIIQLLIAPIAQQSIVYASQMVKDPSHNGTAPLKSFWEESPFEPGNSAPGISYPYNRISLDMTGAILQGLFSRRGLNGTHMYCPSGNCTLDYYPTLSVCVAAKEVTSYLDHPSVSLETNHVCLPGGFCFTEFPPFSNTSDVQSYLLNATSAALHDLTTDESSIQQESGPVWGVPLNYSSIKFDNHSSPIANGYVIFTVQSANGTSLLAAVEYIFDWCGLSMTREVKNNVEHSGPFAKDWLHLRDNGTSYYFDQYNGTEILVDKQTHYSLQRHFRLLFNGSMFYPQVGAGDVTHTSDEVLSLYNALTYPDILHHTDTNPGSLNLSTFKYMLDTVAQGMENYMLSVQDRDLPESAYAPSEILQTIIVIQWGWIAAPVVFCATSTVFWFLILFLGRGKSKAVTCTPRSLVWKSSAIAESRSLSHDLHRMLGGMVDHDTMKQGSKSLYVQLHWDGHSWCLAPDSPKTSTLNQAPETRQVAPTTPA